jgi:hypothetical protein
MKFWHTIFCFFILSFRVQALSPESPDLMKNQHAVFCEKEDAGFFACFNIVIGALDAYDRGKLGGFSVDFGTTGLYYDVSKGANWWRYYFKPLSIEKKHLPRVYLWEAGMYVCNGAYNLSRRRCKLLIEKYIHIRKSVLRKVNAFIRTKMHNKKFVAVQYRGTDKFTAESTYLSQEEACERVSQVLARKKLHKRKIFVATDTQSFVEMMKKRFGKRVVCTKAARSSNGQPVHFRPDIGGYEKGMDALVDCLLLSRSTLLIRTASNLSNTALSFNPKLKSILLNRSQWPDR